jgi:hypothetical protein
MPRKRWLVGLSQYGVGDQDPKKDPYKVNRALIRRVLDGFKKELADLPSKTREQLVEDLAVAIYRARGGVNARKRYVSNKAMAKHVFMLDVGRAMERADLRVTNWEKHEEEGGESLYYQIAHALADVFGLHLPKDLGPLARWAAQIKCGEMSPVMRAAQLEELATQGRQRLGDLAVRLKAAQDAELARQRRRRLREVWGDHPVDPPQSCEKLASAYLGFPF